MATESEKDKRDRIKDDVQSKLDSMPATADGKKWRCHVKGTKIYLTQVKEK
jgi:hypothetical protein